MVDLPFPVLLFIRPAIFAACADNIYNFWDEAGKHGLKERRQDNVNKGPSAEWSLVFRYSTSIIVTITVCLQYVFSILNSCVPTIAGYRQNRENSLCINKVASTAMESLNQITRH